VVTRYAATRHAAEEDRFVEVDHSAAVDRSSAVGHCVVVDRSAEVGRCVVVGRDAAADHFVVLALHIGAFLDVARVGIHAALNAALNVARSAVPNAVRRWGDFRSVALAVAQVAARLVVQIVAQVAIPETTPSSQVVRCAAHSVARDCYAAGSLLPVGRAGVSLLLPAASAARSDPADSAVLQAGLTSTDFRVD